MILTRRVALDDVQLDEIHDAVVIRKVDTGVPHESVSAVSRMGGSGQRMTAQHWDTLEVGVTFAIDVPKRELELRRAIFDQVMAWALRKGWLTTNQRPDRRMYVDKIVFPSGGDMWNWTGEYNLIFRAYSVPFWQDVTQNQNKVSLITSGSTSVEVRGMLETVMDAEFKNKSGKTITRFSITAGGNTLSLAGISLGGSDSIVIHHGTDGLLRITAGGTNVLNKRTGDDDLYVQPGTVTVSVNADRAGELTVGSYGRYL